MLVDRTPSVWAMLEDTEAILHRAAAEPDSECRATLKALGQRLIHAGSATQPKLLAAKLAEVAQVHELRRPLSELIHELCCCTLDKADAVVLESFEAAGLAFLLRGAEQTWACLLELISRNKPSALHGCVEGLCAWLTSEGLTASQGKTHPNALLICKVLVNVLPTVECAQQDGLMPSAALFDTLLDFINQKPVFSILTDHGHLWLIYTASQCLCIGAMHSETCQEKLAVHWATVLNKLERALAKMPIQSLEGQLRLCHAAWRFCAMLPFFIDAHENVTHSIPHTTSTGKMTASLIACSLCRICASGPVGIRPSLIPCVGFLLQLYDKLDDATQSRIQALRQGLLSKSRALRARTIETVVRLLTQANCKNEQPSENATDQIARLISQLLPDILCALRSSQKPQTAGQALDALKMMWGHRALNIQCVLPGLLASGLSGSPSNVSAIQSLSLDLAKASPGIFVKQLGAVLDEAADQLDSQGCAEPGRLWQERWRFHSIFAVYRVIVNAGLGQKFIRKLLHIAGSLDCHGFSELAGEAVSRRSLHTGLIFGILSGLPYDEGDELVSVATFVDDVLSGGHRCHEQLQCGCQCLGSTILSQMCAALCQHLQLEKHSVKHRAEIPVQQTFLKEVFEFESMLDQLLQVDIVQLKQARRYCGNVPKTAGVCTAQSSKDDTEFKNTSVDRHTSVSACQIERSSSPQMEQSGKHDTGLKNTSGDRLSSPLASQVEQSAAPQTEQSGNDDTGFKHASNDGHASKPANQVTQVSALQIEQSEKDDTGFTHTNDARRTRLSAGQAEQDYSPQTERAGKDDTGSKSIGGDRHTSMSLEQEEQSSTSQMEQSGKDDPGLKDTTDDVHANLVAGQVGQGSSSQTEKNGTDDTGFKNTSDDRHTGLLAGDVEQSSFPQNDTQHSASNLVGQLDQHKAEMSARIKRKRPSQKEMDQIIWNLVCQHIQQDTQQSSSTEAEQPSRCDSEQSSSALDHEQVQEGISSLAAKQPSMYDADEPDIPQVLEDSASCKKPSRRWRAECLCSCWIARAEVCCATDMQVHHRITGKRSVDRSGGERIYAKDNKRPCVRQEDVAAPEGACSSEGLKSKQIPCEFLDKARHGGS